VIVRAVQVSDRGFYVVERDPRLLQSGELRVSVIASPITGLDRDVVRGLAGFTGVPGHAFVGRVVDAEGAEASRLLGRRVIGRGSWGCMVCDPCAAGFEENCADRRIPGLHGSDGGHAEEIVLPSRAVLPVDSRLTDEAAALLPLIAPWFAAIDRGQLPDWTNVLVIGDGGVGLLASAALASAGYTVTVRGRHGDRFDFLRQFRANFNLVGDEFEREGLRPGRYGPALMSYPYVVDASGDASGWLAAVELVAPGGAIFMASSALDRTPRPVHRVQEKAARVIGMREGLLEATMEIVANGLFDPTGVITSVHSFEEVQEAYRRADHVSEWIPLLLMKDPEPDSGGQMPVRRPATGLDDEVGS
jgi:threonine dehydrogenase-like Zn-dependent dehydrogenase